MIENKLIPVDDIVIDTLQSRQGLWSGDKQDQALVDSIKGIGLIHDVIVRPTTTKKYGGKTDKPYSLIAGSRRFHALIEAGEYTIPCKVMDFTDAEAIALSFSENLGRKDLAIWEQVIAVNIWLDVLEKEGLPKADAVKQIADTCFKGNRSTIYQAIHIRGLPESVKILLKTPEERTQQETFILKEHKIPEKFSISLESMDIISQISEQLLELPDSTKAEKLLDMVGKLNLHSESYDNSLAILRDVRDKLKEGKSFDLVIKTVKEELSKRFEMLHEEGIRILIPANYEIWHKQACDRARTPPEKLILKIYLDWLTKEARREGW